MGMQGEYAVMCRDPRVLDAISAQFAELGKTAGLMSFEMPKRIRVLDKPFSIELDELTPTLKVKRTVLKTHFRKEIEEEYAKGPVS
jgi:long-chain acyl-CoA synthetase